MDTKSLWLFGPFSLALWFRMKYLREIFTNATMTSKLMPKYHRITSRIGAVAGVLSLAVFLYLGVIVASALGYEGGRPIEGIVNILLTLLLTMSLLIVSMFIGFFIVVGGFSFLMLLKGEFSAREALYYTIFSRFPARWFSEKP